MGATYPSAEMQSVYSAAPSDWAIHRLKKSFGRKMILLSHKKKDHHPHHYYCYHTAQLTKDLLVEHKYVITQLFYKWFYLVSLLYFDLRPGQKCHSRWCTGRKWHIPTAVSRGNRVGGNWLTKLDKLKNPMILS